MKAARLLEHICALLPVYPGCFLFSGWFVYQRCRPQPTKACISLPDTVTGRRMLRMNPEHPPLAKLIGAAPLLFLHPKLDTNSMEWQRAYEYDFGFQFLYGNNADRLLFWSRTAMMILTGIGLIVTFLWARDLFGIPAGVVAAGMYAFSPNLLAHGVLVTTDVPLAVFMLLTLYFFWKGEEKRSWLLDAVTGLALGAAMAAKFSGAFLPVLLVVLSLTQNRRSAFKTALGYCVRFPPHDRIDVFLLCLAACVLQKRNSGECKPYPELSVLSAWAIEVERMVVLLSRSISFQGHHTYAPRYRVRHLHRIQRWRPAAEGNRAACRHRLLFSSHFRRG